jgi:acetyltransferase
MSDIRRMLSPKTVAIVGATEKSGSVGRTVTENLLQSENRKVYPINPKYETILGAPTLKSVKDIPEPLDLCVIATPAQMVPDMVEECGEAGASGLIIVSAGFKEIGAEGKELEERISRSRVKYGMRIIGPNCLGVIRPNIGLNATFLKANPEPGRIALISQSGALGSAMLDWAIRARIGFSMFASLGSMLDVDFGDLIDFLGEDSNTRSIIVYMEGVGNAKKFMSAARGFARSKPIIIVKSGRFSESSGAALSHTGAMAGDDQVYDAAFKRVGVVRVKEVADLFNAASVLDSRHLPQGPRIAIVTNAGGPGVMAADSVIEFGEKLAKISQASIKELDQSLPHFWSHSNPVDVLGDASAERYVKAINVCLKDDVDGILVLYTPQGQAEPEELAAAVAEIAKTAPKPILTSWMGGERILPAREIFAQAGVPTYETPEEAVKTYSFMNKYSLNLSLLYETPSTLPVDISPPKNNLKALIKRIIREGRTVLSEEEAKRFLVDYGISVSRPYATKSAEDAVNCVSRVGYPVVLKILSADISHKSDVGGVIVGVRSDEELIEAYARMMANVKAKAPNVRIEGITIQRMLEPIDYEIILGTKKDKDFGSVILFGMGGIGAEVFRDFSVGIPPLNQTLARRLMEETKFFNVIQGYRGKAPADLAQLEQIIMSVSNMVVDFPEIAEMDINPLAISNGKAYALDARIILDKDVVEGISRYPHLVISPYPTKYVMPWRLDDGTDVILRPIRPEDELLEREMLTSLSMQSMRNRFFGYINEITHEMLIRFCNIDYDREMAIIGEVTQGDKKKIIGIGRLIMDADYRTGEFAVVVHDEHQGRGLGYKLVDLLIGVAQEKGMQSIQGVVLTENKVMLEICERLGFTITPMPDETSKVELVLK